MTTPAFLSFPLANNFAIEPIDIEESFETDSGHVRRRPRYTVVPEVITCAGMLTQAQYDEFDVWFEDVLIAGARPFSWALLGSTKTSMFLAPPKADVNENMIWRVSAKLLRGVGVLGTPAA